MAHPTVKSQVAARIDPRIRRRLLDVRRREARRRRRVLVAVTAVAGLAVGGWVAGRSPLLDVDRVHVEGTVHTAAHEVVRAAGVRRGDALVDVDAGAAATAVGRLPWVDRVTVRREWPRTVTIQVVERVPVAAAPVGDRAWALIDADRRVLELVPSPPEGLPSVSGREAVGPPGSRLGPGWAAVLEVAAHTPASMLGRFGPMSETDDGEVELALVPAGVVRFGPPELVREKFTAIATVLARVPGGDVAVLDVRIPRAPVLTRQGPADKVSTRTTG